jgi:hypothetical protein
MLVQRQGSGSPAQQANHIALLQQQKTFATLDATALATGGTALHSLYMSRCGTHHLCLLT